MHPSDQASSGTRAPKSKRQRIWNSSKVTIFDATNRIYKRYTSGKNSIHIAEGSSSSVKRETSGQEKESETSRISQSQTFANKNKEMENYTLPTKLLSTLSKQCNTISDTFVTGYVNVCVDKQEPENRGQSGLPGWTMPLQGKADFLVGSCHCCQAHLDVRVGAVRSFISDLCGARIYWHDTLQNPRSPSPVLRTCWHALSQTRPQRFRSTKLTLLWTHPAPSPQSLSAPRTRKLPLVASPSLSAFSFTSLYLFKFNFLKASSPWAFKHGLRRTGQVPELDLSFHRSTWPPPLSTEVPSLQPFSVVSNPVYTEIWAESKWPPLPKSHQVQKKCIFPYNYRTLSLTDCFP